MLVVTLAALFALELAWKSALRQLSMARHWRFWRRRARQHEKNAEDVDVHVWQEMQRDRAIKEKLRRMASDRDSCGHDVEMMEHVHMS